MAANGWRDKFLEAVRVYPVIKYACDAAGVSRAQVYKERDKDDVFREAWERAKQDGLDRLELVAYQRAHENDSGLLKWLLSSNRPDPYCDKTRHEVTGKDGAVLDVVLSWKDPRVGRDDEDDEDTSS